MPENKPRPCSVNEMLGMPFDEALRECEAMRRYIEDDEDADELREEFRENWDVYSAPSELRNILQAFVSGREPVSVEQLLSGSFEDALVVCPGLRAFIEEGDEPAELYEEFREAWRTDAPAGLRTVLHDILNPETRAVEDDFERGLAAIGEEGDEDQDERPSMIGYLGGPGPELDVSSSSAPSSRVGEVNAQNRGGLSVGEIERISQDAERDAGVFGGRSAAVRDDDEDGIEDGESQEDAIIGSRVEALLCMPFEQAWSSCQELRSYIEGQGAEAADIRQEFEQCWSAEAPNDLRQVLAEIAQTEFQAASASKDQHLEQMKRVMRGAGNATDMASFQRESPDALRGGEGEGGPRADIDAEIESLLGKTFEEAFRACHELRAYIDRQGSDAADLRKEFAQCWSPDAPEDLRHILAQILDPNAEVTNSAEAAEFADQYRAFVPQGSAAAHDGDSASQIRMPSVDDMDMIVRSTGSAAFDPSANSERLLSASEEQQQDEDDMDDRFQAARLEEIAALLCKPFEKALQDCPALRAYIDQQGDDAAEVEEEFRHSWSPDAPDGLRQVLLQILDPTADAVNAAEAAEFVQLYAPGQEDPTKPPKSRL